MDCKDKRDPNLIYDNLRMLIRTKYKMTNREFCEKVVKVPHTSLKGVLDGLQNPRLDTLINLANRTKTSLDWLCSEHEYNNN